MAKPHIPISTKLWLHLLSTLLFLFSKTHLSLSLTDQSTAGDIHDLLPKYGLPAGLLPGNVKSYTLSPSGSFWVQLSTPCYVHFDHLVYYSEEIRGTLTHGAVRDVSGIQAKQLFLWLPVSGIEVSKVDDGMIQFFVGPLSVELPAHQFEKIPACKSKVASRSNNMVDSI